MNIKMKYLFLLIGFWFQGQLIGFAQAPSPDFKKMAANEAAAMKKDLSISNPQYDKLLVVLEKFYANMNQIRTTGETGVARKEKMRTVFLERESDIKSILNNEQFKKYRSHIDQRKSQASKDTVTKKIKKTYLIN
jgi:hypothetical protein